LSPEQTEEETFVERVLTEFLRRIRDDPAFDKSVHDEISRLIEANELSNSEKLLRILSKEEVVEDETTNS
jgi:hypothetical protein